MKKLRFLVIITCLQVCLLACRESPLTIYYTSSLEGNLDGCYCPSDKKAGLTKRAYEMRRLQGEYLLIDGGNLFDQYGDEALNDILLMVYSELKYDAIGIGPNEFGSGVEYLQKKAAQYPLLAANIYVNKGKTVGSRYLIREKSNRKIGIFSLADPHLIREKLTHKALFKGDQENITVQVTDPVAAGKRIVEEIKKEKVDIIVLLAQLSTDECIALAGKIKGITLIVAGNDELLLEAPLIVGDTIIVNPGKNGNYLGKLILGFKSGRAGVTDHSLEYFTYRGRKDDPDVKKLSDEYIKSLYQKLRNN